MLRVTFCLKRLPGLSRAEFQDYWLYTHAPLVAAHAAALGIRKYLQSHSVDTAGSSPLADVRGSTGLDYDGVAQLWWENMKSFATAGATEEGRAAGALLLEDEKRFIDLPNSPIFLSEDHGIVG